MNKPISIMTRQQLELILSQRIQDLYRERLEQEAGKVSCRLFENKVAIVLEDAICRPVQILAENNQRDLAQQLRLNLEAAIKPELVRIIEELFKVRVIDLLADATLETGRSGTIAILDSTPDNIDVAPEMEPKKMFRNVDN